MPDLFHTWGLDLSLGPTGDLLPVDGSAFGQQRVLRRLLTSPGSYLWHTDYGAGLPACIGATPEDAALKAVILNQMALEPAVAQSPQPKINATPIPNGVSVTVRYVDSTSGAAASVDFDLPV